MQWEKTEQTVVFEDGPAGIAKWEEKCITNILADLRSEREQLEEAILALERLVAGGTRRRGRPPAWMAKLKDETIEKPRRGRPPSSKNRKAEA